VAHVAREVVQPRQASLIAESVHRLRRASDFNPRRAHGIRGLEPPASRFGFCSHRHVQPELLFQVRVAPAWKQRAPETVNPFAKGAHAIFLRHASGSSTVRTVPDIRSGVPCTTSASGRALLDVLMKYHLPH
jgi:hypothetical protein